MTMTAKYPRVKIILSNEETHKIFERMIYMMKLMRHHFKDFNEKYMYNLLDCNHQYHVGMHVLSDDEEDIIRKATELVDETLKGLIGKVDLQFTEMAVAKRCNDELRDYKYEVVIDAIVKTEEEAKKLIALFR